MTWDCCDIPTTVAWWWIVAATCRFVVAAGPSQGPVPWIAVVTNGPLCVVVNVTALGAVCTW